MGQDLEPQREPGTLGLMHDGRCSSKGPPHLSCPPVAMVIRNMQLELTSGALPEA